MCGSCGSEENINTSASVTTSPSATSQAFESAPPSETLPTVIPRMLPLPWSKMYGLEGYDAILFDAAVQYYSTRGDGITLCIPALKLLDSYKNEDGDTCYICQFHTYDFYDLAYGLSDLTHPVINLYNGGYSLARFTLRKTQEGETMCSDIMVIMDDDGWEYSIKAICGPKTELAEAIIKDERQEFDGRYLVQNDSTAMLNTFIDYCFGRQTAN